MNIGATKIEERNTITYEKLYPKEYIFIGENTEKSFEEQRQELIDIINSQPNTNDPSLKEITVSQVVKFYDREDYTLFGNILTFLPGTLNEGRKFKVAIDKI